MSLHNTDQRIDFIKFDADDVMYEDYCMWGLQDMVGWLMSKANSINPRHHTKIWCYFEHNDFFHDVVSEHQKLTDSGCDFVPKYISSRVIMSGKYISNIRGCVHSFFITETVMEKVEGKSVSQLLGYCGENFPECIPDGHVELRTEIEKMYYTLENTYNVTVNDKWGDCVVIDQNNKLWIIDFGY